jgi:prepilin-type N-terminal cleavage/methylation domain-containing protein
MKQKGFTLIEIMVVIVIIGVYRPLPPSRQVTLFPNTGRKVVI